jgi:hypothetical protein
MTHPLTPPPELVQQWIKTSGYKIAPEWLNDVIQKVVQYGANQELEAIIELAEASSLPEKDRYFDGLTVASLRAVRRPKPPSLKELALETLKYPKDLWSESEVDTIRRALEALPND